MSILEELNTLVEGLGLPVETGVFSEQPPETYIVLTPLNDEYALYADNYPQADIHQVRLSLFCYRNYLNTKAALSEALLAADFTVTERRYMGREDDSGYHQYIVDVEKEYTTQEEE